MIIEILGTTIYNIHCFSRVISEKYDLPGGVIFSGKDMLSEANEEIKRLEDEVQMRYELPPGFCVG